MHASALLGFLATAACVAAQATGKLGDAKVITDSPKDAAYVAKFSGSVTGSVNAVSEAAGKGVTFKLELEGFNTTAGPFKYHIHVNPVPTDGNCTGTGGHLDPYQRTDTPACDNTKPQTCEVGDLSGKWGTIAETKASKSFTDQYVTFNSADVAFFGNRSIVFHDASSARIACANLTVVAKEPVPAAACPV